MRLAIEGGGFCQPVEEDDDDQVDDDIKYPRKSQSKKIGQITDMGFHKKNDDDTQSDNEKEEEAFHLTLRMTSKKMSNSNTPSSLENPRK